MYQQNDNTPIIRLVKASGTAPCNYLMWEDSMDKHAVENPSVHLYWKTGVEPEFETPAFEEQAVDAAGIAILVNGDIVMRPILKYRSIAVGTDWWKADNSRVETDKTEYRRNLPRFVKRLLMTLSPEIENELVNVEDYEEEKARMNLTFLKTAIRFIATGAGGVSIALDALNLQRMDLDGESPADLAKFVRNFKEGVKGSSRRRGDGSTIMRHREDDIGHVD